MESLRSRTILAVLGIGLAVLWLLPNFINTHGKDWLPQKKLNYGLDIQGGLHLVMGVDVNGVVGESAARLAQSLKSELAKDGASITDVRVSKAAEGEVQILATGEAKAKAVKFIEERYSTMLQKMEDVEGSVSFRYLETYMRDYKDKVIHQAIETIRNRIDEFGVAEPSISQQGADRILVQLPGMADAEKAKALINTAAKLDFMMVLDDKAVPDLQALVNEAEKAGQYNLTTLKYSDYVTKLNQDLKSKIPANAMVIFEKADNAVSLEAGRVPFLVTTDTGLGGGDLDDAYVSFNEYGAPEVALSFNAAGGAKFKSLTGASIGKRMAVVLDKVVKTAPQIQTQIGDGRAVITLGGGLDRQKSMDEAKMISTALRAGALPASLEQLEERRIGPSLGADAIKKAQLGSYVGAILILLFMAFRYKGMGLVTDLSMIFNILIMFALLSSLGATLTLPGIAGIALTVGFAVDANVLINERIREELAAGASFAMAVKEGYSRAMSAILDSNVTTAATAVVLLYFGTGPVRGFAVTLLAGLVTTLFANVFLSKVFVDTLIYRFNVKKMSV